MQIQSLTCPTCGAPVKMAKNVIAVICSYCGAQVERSNQDEANTQNRLEMGKSALIAGNYEQADLVFSNIILLAPENNEAWLGKAIAISFKEYETIGQFHASMKHVSEDYDLKLKYVKELTSSDNQFYRDCLLVCLKWIGEEYGQLLIDGLLSTVIEKYRADIAKACVLFAEKQWEVGNVEQAIVYRIHAVELDNTQESHNLLLMDYVKARMDDNNRKTGD